MVPAKVLEELKEAAAVLDTIADNESRKEFIRQNSDKWCAVREYLLTMSHGKCWYSESLESVSRYQVDHFRPHGRSKQAEKEYADGYSWLAFDADNFRLAGVLCNTVNREHSEETVGKGDWFPLVDPEKRATITNRDCAAETPILLDPTDPDDVNLIIFNDDGSPAPTPEIDDVSKMRVTVAIKCLGLDQSMLSKSRRMIWRECFRTILKYDRIARKPRGCRSPEEAETMRELGAELVGMSRAERRFSAVARSCLTANRLTKFILRNELEPLSAEL